MTDKSAKATETRVPKQLTPWTKGQSGNPAGRPKGARHKLDDLFVRALYDDFKLGGKEAIVKCREEKPDVYLNVIAKIVPKQVDVTADESLANFADGLQAVAAFLGSFTSEDSGTDHAGPVPDRPILSAGSRSQAH